jgi:predicted lipase
MNRTEAMLCAVVAQGTYVNRCDDSNFQLFAKFENKGTDTQGFAGEAFGDTFMIGFRGSEETGTADWITDLKFVLSAYPFLPAGAGPVKVHYGFIEAFSSVRDAILPMVRDSKQTKVLTTGHSLGGALAILAALDIRQNVPDKQVSCYTFGSPKVGDPAFAKFYDGRVPNTFRIVNDADIIPTIPPVGYAHVGQLYHLQASKIDSGGLVEAVTKRVSDHLPHNYIAALDKFLRSEG